jgi:Zn-dependent protease
VADTTLTSPTPILDLQSPLPTVKKSLFQSGRRVVLRVVRFFAGVLAFFALTSSIVFVVGDAFWASHSKNGTQILWVWLLFIIGIVPAIMIHELGHIIAGRSMKMSFRSIRLGPLLISKNAERLRATLPGGSLLSGGARMSLQRLSRASAALRLFHTGGILANVASAAVTLAMLDLTGLIHDQKSLFVQICRVFVMISLFLTVFNLIPIQFKNGSQSDGARLWGLVSSKERIRQQVCFYALLMQVESGVLARYLKRTWIGQACASANIVTKSLGLVLAHSAASDRGDIDAAAQSLEKALEIYPALPMPLQQLVLSEAAIFQAWSRNDAEKASGWHQLSAANPTGEKLQRMRLEICMHWVDGEYAEAESLWHKGLAYIEASPSLATNASRPSWIAWKEDIDKRKAYDAPIH